MVQTWDGGNRFKNLEFSLWITLNKQKCENKSESMKPAHVWSFHLICLAWMLQQYFAGCWNSPHTLKLVLNDRIDVMITVRYRYNAENTHNIHPIARPWGRSMMCLLWFWSLIYAGPLYNGTRLYLLVFILLTLNPFVECCSKSINTFWTTPNKGIKCP